MKKRGACTLIDLLVAISVIALLLALLIPALNKGRAGPCACPGQPHRVAPTKSVKSCLKLFSNTPTFDNICLVEGYRRGNIAGEREK